MGLTSVVPGWGDWGETMIVWLFFFFFLSFFFSLFLKSRTSCANPLDPFSFIILFFFIFVLIFFFAKSKCVSTALDLEKFRCLSNVSPRQGQRDGGVNSILFHCRIPPKTDQTPCTLR